jgi:hypothetical protein
VAEKIVKKNVPRIGSESWEMVRERERERIKSTLLSKNGGEFVKGIQCVNFWIQCDGELLE